MRMLVTGGAGFIGGSFVRRALERRPDCKIICVDSLTYAGNMESLASALDNPALRFVKADITDEAAMERVFAAERPDVVVNFAAESHVDRSIGDPGVFLRTNVMGTQVLLEASRRHGVERFHQVSTDEVYGDLPLDRPDLLFTEESPVRASSPYSASKAGADLLALAYWRTYKLPVSVSRCSNNYGPYHFPEKLIPLAIANALRGEPVPVYGSGENVRDWLYVEDHCRAIDLIIDKGRAGEAYNIGGRCEMRNIDVVRRVLRELGKGEELIRRVGDRAGHDLRYAIDAGKMERELGWRPETGFEEGIRKTVRWYAENRGWWERVLDGEYKEYYERQYGRR
jgi:dTDP-glucose 4,6-dehydratase